MSSIRKSSDSYLRIWKTVCKIPKGRVSTYGAIADACGLWGQARLVGYALHNLPHGSDVPWQRVINSQGKISFSRNSDMYALQKRLLRKEGVSFRGEKTSLMMYGWRCNNTSTSQMKGMWKTRRNRYRD
jgi:methylated-DNA-protein-cysteine methyltransferase related protein